MRKLLLWGIGNIYNVSINLINHFESIGGIEVVALTAKEIPAHIKYIDGYPVIDVREISHLDYDYIMVMSEEHYWGIFHEITARGIPSDKIIPCKILKIPNLDIEDYFYLKESRLSIISNNCWGGMVYNILGLECISPFKNLFFLDEDYIKLLENLEYYLSIEPKAAGWDCLYENLEYKVVRFEDRRYPMIALNDIMVRCNHMKNHEEALEKWNSRRKKFNFDNIFVEMSTDNKYMAEKFQTMDKFPKKVCFVSWKTNEKGLVYLNPIMNETRTGLNANLHAELRCSQLNLVHLLCKKDCIRWK